MRTHPSGRNLAGWHRSLPDPRDKVLQAAPNLPSTADVRTHCPPIFDQGQLGSCTANAGCAAASFVLRKQGAADPTFSRLDLYAATRELEGTPLNEDSGAQVRSVFKAMRAYGVCTEKTWPYVPSKFSHAPPRRAVIEALSHRALSYHSCRTLYAIKTSLAQGWPAIGGFTCFSSMFTAAVEATGQIPLPGSNDGVEGGHCVMFVGYDDMQQHFVFQNSWGSSWGAGGFGFLPYNYVTDRLADDFWTLRRETE